MAPVLNHALFVKFEYSSMRPPVRIVARIYGVAVLSSDCDNRQETDGNQEGAQNGPVVKKSTNSIWNPRNSAPTLIARLSS